MTQDRKSVAGKNKIVYVEATPQVLRAYQITLEEKQRLQKRIKDLNDEITVLSDRLFKLRTGWIPEECLSLMQLRSEDSIPIIAIPQASSISIEKVILSTKDSSKKSKKSIQNEVLTIASVEKISEEEKTEQKAISKGTYDIYKTPVPEPDPSYPSHSIDYSTIQSRDSNVEVFSTESKRRANAAAVKETIPEEVEPNEEAVEPNEEAVEPNEEAVEPNEEAVEPSVLIVESNKETIKSNTETIKPNKEAIKPNKETVETSKETVKPSKQTVKPSKETVKPSKETVKPSKETVKPNKDIGEKVDLISEDPIEEVPVSHKKPEVVSEVPKKKSKPPPKEEEKPKPKVKAAPPVKTEVEKKPEYHKSEIPKSTEPKTISVKTPTVERKQKQPTYSAQFLHMKIGQMHNAIQYRTCMAGLAIVFFIFLNLF